MHERETREEASNGVEEENRFGREWGDEVRGVRGEDESGGEGIGKDPEDGEEEVEDEEDDAVKGGDLRRHHCGRCRTL